MTEIWGPRGRLLVVDDDAVMRELLIALLEIEGYEVLTVASGEEALEMLAGGEEIDVLLVDLHMPGVQGAELVRRLQRVKEAETLLIGMSGSPMNPEEAGLFDGFLRKPFAMETLNETVQHARLEGRPVVEEKVAVVSEAAEPVLNEEIVRRLAAILPAEQLRELYRITVEDILKRVERMRDAETRGDLAEYRGEAHAIKGGCGMVGAVEIAALAARAEACAEPGNISFHEFTHACERLQRMLDARI